MLTTRGHVGDVCVAVSEATADVHRELRALRSPVRVVHNAGAAAPPTRPPRATGAPVVFGYLGQLTSVKGIHTLLAAFPRLPPGRAQLLVGGRGELADEVRGPGVEALGWLDDAAREQFFARIDCLIVPSEWQEPGALVTLEARERGLPVIAARSGGLPEYVDDRSRALMFDPGDVAGLVASMQLVIEDVTRYQPEPGANGITWEQHVDAIEAAYAEAIEAKQ
jgi:glycosyltransferase involved in cell wall biosynthesis